MHVTNHPEYRLVSLGYCTASVICLNDHGCRNTHRIEGRGTLPPTGLADPRWLAKRAEHPVTWRFDASPRIPARLTCSKGRLECRQLTLHSASGTDPNCATARVGAEAGLAWQSPVPRLSNDHDVLGAVPTATRQSSAKPRHTAAGADRLSTNDLRSQATRLPPRAPSQELERRTVRDGLQQ